MKKLRNLITMLLVVVMLTGCMKIEMTMKVTKDDVSITIVEAMLKEYYDQMTQQGNSTEERKKYEDKGFKVEEYSDSAYKGMKFSKSFGSLEKVSTKGELPDGEFDVTADDIKIFKIDDSVEGKTRYIAKLKLNLTSDFEDYDFNDNGTTTDDDADDDDAAIVEDDETGDEIEDTNTLDDNNGLDDLKQLFDVKIVVELPVEPLKSNATNTNGKVLTWDKTFNGEYIEFEFELTGKEASSSSEDNNLILYIAIGGGALLLIAVVLILMKSKNKKNGPEAAPLANEPIPNVGENKMSSLTPVNPTAPAAPSVTSVDTPKVEEEKPATMGYPKVESTVTVEPPKPVQVGIPEVTTPEEAKTE